MVVTLDLDHLKWDFSEEYHGDVEACSHCDQVDYQFYEQLKGVAVGNLMILVIANNYIEAFARTPPKQTHNMVLLCR